MSQRVADIYGVTSLSRTIWHAAKALSEGQMHSKAFWFDNRLESLINYLATSKLFKLEVIQHPESLRAKYIEPRNDICNLFGAGIDSFIAHYQVERSRSNKNHVNLWVDYGQPYAQKELECINRLSELTKKAFKVYLLRIPSPYEHIANFDYLFPLRNLLLASLGLVDADVVWISANKRDKQTATGALDKTEHFFNEATEVFSDYYQHRVLVQSPQSAFSKSEMIQWYLDENLPIEHLFATTSCYDPDLYKCGVCYSCFKRYQSFRKLDITEPDYHTDPQESPNYESFIERERLKGRID